MQANSAHIFTNADVAAQARHQKECTDGKLGAGFA